MENKYSILIISAYPPSRSAGLAQDMITGLEGEGHNVDFFTMYAFKGQMENQYNIYPEPITDKLRRIKQMFPLLQGLKKLVKAFLKTPEDKMTSVENHGYRIPHYNEAEPPVDDETLRRYLPDKNYDFIMIYITERMITTPSFVTIYEKYKVPMLIACLDMLHFTGGCYFFGDCRRFMAGCGKCLVLDSDDENDQTHKNYLIKASVYPKIEYAILCNTYMKQFGDKCGLFPPEKIYTFGTLIDEEVFKPGDSKECREYFGISDRKKHVILARYVPGMGRAKGYDHMIDIINTLYEMLSDEERKGCLLALIGSRDDGITKKMKLDAVCLGYMNLQDLVKSYNASSVFISTSVDDAGPSMVNQSMMCGTPVVTFSIGTALDVTRAGVNGYMAINFDNRDFANGIYKILRMPSDDYLQMRIQTRDSAIEMNSKEACAKQVIRVYEKMVHLQA